jgi:DNA-directed RNA polymerase specialized sigma24 family protein
MDHSFNQAAYRKLFELLEPGEETDEAQFRRCRLKLFKFFAWRRCDDPGNLADETIVRLLKNFIDGRIVVSGKPYGYVYGIADNVFLEYCRAKKKQAMESDAATNEQVVHLPVVDDCQVSCLKELSAPQFELLERYYLGKDDRNKQAQELRVTLNSLRLKIHRIKCELRRCCDDCRRKSKT